MEAVNICFFLCMVFEIIECTGESLTAHTHRRSVGGCGEKKPTKSRAPLVSFCFLSPPALSTPPSHSLTFQCVAWHALLRPGRRPPASGDRNRCVCERERGRVGVSGRHFSCAGVHTLPPPCYPMRAATGQPWPVAAP